MEWILCDDRLPEEGQMVLTTIRGHDVIIPQDGETIEQAIERIWDEVCYVSVGFIGSDGWYGADGFPQIVHPIAWMPLPKPYTADTPQTDLLVKTPHNSRESHEKNCETCRDKDAYDEWEGNCDECENGSMYTPQTDYPCNTCANKGDHDGECKNCVTDSAPIRWKTPSHYKPKDEPQTDCPWK